MYFCSIHLIQYKYKSQTWRYFEGFLSKWKQGAVSPLCLELCPCLLVTVPEKGPLLCLSRTQSSSAIPSDPIAFPSESRRPRFPSAGTATSSWSGCKCTQTWNIYKSSPIWDSQNMGRSSECLPPTQTGPCTLELCCLTLFPTPILSPLGCAFPASAVRETRIL